MGKQDFGSLAAGFMKGLTQNKERKTQADIQKRKDDRDDKTAKLQGELFKIKLANAKYKQSVLDMMSKMPQFQALQNQGGQGQPSTESIEPTIPGQVDSPKFGKSFDTEKVVDGGGGGGDVSGAGVVDQISQAQMDPMVAALLKEVSGVDVPGALRLGESRRNNVAQESISRESLEERKRGAGVREGVSRESLDETKRANTFQENLAILKFSREGSKVVQEPVMINGIPHLQSVNSITKKPVGDPKPIGQMKGLPAESAGKVAMAVNARQYVSDLEKMLIKPDGSVNKELLFKMAVPAGGIGEGRIALSLFGDAVDSRIRAATGAAVSKEDWELYKRIYLPSVRDLTADPKLIKQKMSRFSDFINSYLRTIDPSGNFERVIKKGQPGGSKTSNRKVNEIQLPDSKISELQEGQITTFGNGQEWTITNGQPVRVN